VSRFYAREVFTSSRCAIGRHETVLIFNTASRLRENTFSRRVASQVAAWGRRNACAGLAKRERLGSRKKRSHEDAEDSERSLARVDVTNTGPRAGHHSKLELSHRRARREHMPDHLARHPISGIAVRGTERPKRTSEARAQTTRSID